VAVSELHHPGELAPLVHAALRAWYNTGPDNKELLDGLILTQDRRRGELNSTNPTALRLATNQILLEGIEELETRDQTGGRVLRSRFADDDTLMAVAHRLNVSEHTVSRLQRSAINHLAEILFEREMAAREEQIQAIESRFPPPSYTNLFGLSDATEQLLEIVTSVERPRVVAIVGIGGIGKTALADV